MRDQRWAAVSWEMAAFAPVARRAAIMRPWSDTASWPTA
jgi:hypothetical protein